MNETSQPQLIERACGGWLALAPREAPVRIGVTADDEGAAREALTAALKEWDRLLGVAASRTHDG